MTQVAIQFHDRVSAARDEISAQKLFQPQIAIVLGSGLGELASHVEHATSIPYASIPHFPLTHAVGHAGRLILGFLSGVPVVLMQGRSHRYEGFTNLDCIFPIFVMHALGAHTLLTTNAAGGLNTRFQTGDLMLIDSHLDFLSTRNQPPWPLPVDAPMAVRGKPAYDAELMQRCKKIARQQDTVLHQGCYLATLGPTYETRSEYRMFRRVGADAVGMSTVPEVLAARQLAMRVAAFSVITNVASTDIPQSTTHDEVVDSGNLAGPKLMGILQSLLEEFAGQPD